MMELERQGVPEVGGPAKMILFLTRIARRRNFHDVSFDFEPDAKEMNKIFFKI